jgi:hypothetical protein
LEFEIVFVDEFWLNDETYAKYNWAACGEAAFVLISKYIKPLFVVLAMTGHGMVLIRSIKKHADSDSFCPIMLELSNVVKTFESVKQGKLVIMMDNATFHTSKKTRSYIKSLGLPVFYSAPNCPEINADEYTIGNIKAVVKKLRDANK